MDSGSQLQFYPSLANSTKLHINKCNQSASISTLTSDDHALSAKARKNVYPLAVSSSDSALTAGRSTSVDEIKMHIDLARDMATFSLRRSSRKCKSAM